MRFGEAATILVTSKARCDTCRLQKSSCHVMSCHVVSCFYESVL